MSIYENIIFRFYMKGNTCIFILGYNYQHQHSSYTRMGNRHTNGSRLDPYLYRSGLDPYLTHTCTRLDRYGKNCYTRGPE